MTIRVVCCSHFPITLCVIHKCFLNFTHMRIILFVYSCTGSFSLVVVLFTWEYIVPLWGLASPIHRAQHAQASFLFSNSSASSTGLCRVHPLVCFIRLFVIIHTENYLPHGCCSSINCQPLGWSQLGKCLRFTRRGGRVRPVCITHIVRMCASPHTHA